VELPGDAGDQGQLGGLLKLWLVDPRHGAPEIEVRRLLGALEHVNHVTDSHHHQTSRWDASEFLKANPDPPNISITSPANPVTVAPP
jgi:hypothetical protein